MGSQKSASRFILLGETLASGGSQAVKTQGGITLHQFAEALQASEGFSGIEFLLVFGNHRGRGIKKLRVAQPIKSGAVRLLETVRWIEEAEIRSYREAVELAQGAADVERDDLEATFNA